MDATLRALVRERAAECCEYCRRRQADSPLIPFHIEHIVSRKHGGTDHFDNLALACAECNLHKGTDLVGIDPESGDTARLYDPRAQRWENHFAREGARILGLTPTGRATVRVLDLNSRIRLRVRLATST
jgi:5-methylcytosine-specific restriction endonuclease McrA